MITLAFRSELYDGFAVDEAVKTFEPFATIERAEADGRFELRVAAHEGHDEAEIAGELANYALGRTIERRTNEETGPGAAPAAPDGGGDALR